MVKHDNYYIYTSLSFTVVLLVAVVYDFIAVVGFKMLHGVPSAWSTPILVSMPTMGKICYL